MKLGSVIIWAVTLIAIVITLSTQAYITKHDYASGYNAAIQEAYANGLMETVQLSDGTTVLRWIETHKLGYE